MFDEFWWTFAPRRMKEIINLVFWTNLLTWYKSHTFFI